MNAFFGALFLSTIALLIFAAAMIMRSAFFATELTQPRCAKCKYDIRQQLIAAPENRRCPECGQDLNHDHAVVFGRSRIRWKPIIVLFACASLGLLLMFVVEPSTGGINPSNLGSQTNATLLATLPTAVNQPWHWQELERRLASGKLSPAETQAALNVLIASFKPAGNNGPLSWTRDFIKAAFASGNIPQSQMLQFYQAYYGPPVLTMRPVQSNDKPVEFQLDFNRNPWNLNDEQLVFALKPLKLADGSTPLIANLMNGGLSDPDLLSGTQHRAISGRFVKNLPAGEYKLIFDVDMGVLPRSSPLVGLQNSPGQKQRWVKPILSWNLQIPFTLKVAEAGVPLVALVQDPASDPGNVLPRPSLLAHRDLKGAIVDVKFDKPSSVRLAVPLCVEVIVIPTGGAESAPSGIIMREVQDTMLAVIFAKPIAPQITTAKVILRPAPKTAERTPDVTQIWGKEIIFENVPLDRYDLPTTKPAE